MEMEKRQHSTASCKIGNEVHYVKREKTNKLQQSDVYY